MREIVFDTETTGTNPLAGDRVIQIAAIELVNLLPTGRQFDRIVDPGRDSDPDAERVHGISRARTMGQPEFGAIWPEFRDFIGDSPLVAHNAGFDFGFLDAELRLIGQSPLDRARMVDTLVIARNRFPGLPNSLDALCRRFDIDLSERVKHEALLDVKLLAQVYLELRGGRQPGLTLAAAAPRAVARAAEAAPLGPRTPRRLMPDDAAVARNAAFRAAMKLPPWPDDAPAG